MALKAHVKIDLSPWLAKNERVKGAIAAMRPWEIYPPDEENLKKAFYSIERHDVPSCYPISPEVLELGGSTLAKGLRDVATTKGKRNIDREMLVFGKAALKDVKANIRERKVLGPDRSEEWNDRKGHNINMIGLTKGPTKFVRAITVRLANRKSR